MASGDLTAGDFTYLPHENLDDMQNCILIHPYAGPLVVLMPFTKRRCDSADWR